MDLNRTIEIKEEELLNTPIDFMRLEESDFKGLDAKKTQVELKSSGYLMDSNIFKIIKLKEPGTVVVNSGVGQGKSRFAIEMAVEYFSFTMQKKDKYTIIFAVPYKSLISQYKRNIIHTIRNYYASTLIIPDYNKLNLPTDSLFPIHIMTIDCLLGNPGENSVEQNKKKQEYLDGIIKYAQDTQRKIILIFDEIHDGIDNFKQDLIFNLLKFRTSNTLFKAFILSATFSEASKIVIKYISHLTNKKLQILETKRIQRKNPEKLSNLHLYFAESYHYQFNENPSLDEYLKEIIEKHDNLDILFYSQTQVKNILNSGNIREQLVNKYSNINLCISEKNKRYINVKEYEPIKISDKFQSSACNIGTVFKTGINIEKKNSAFVIVLPSNNAVKNNELGIFQSTIDVTQAIARVRNKSEIYVIMPKPKKVISISKSEDNQKYMQVLNRIKYSTEVPTNNDNSPMYQDYSFTNQNRLVTKMYNKLKAKVQDEIDYVGKLEYDKQIALNYPMLGQFILNKSDSYFSKYFAIFGADYPAYMLWASINNQFVNCKLKTISSIAAQEIHVNTKNIHDIFSSFFENNITSFCRNFEMYDFNLYKSFCDYLLFNKLYFDDSKKPVTESNDMFQRLIMSFLQKAWKGNERLHEKYANSSLPFEAEDYLLCCMANAIQYNKDKDEVIDNNYGEKVIEAYQDLYNKIRQIFKEKLFMQHNGNNYIHPEFKAYRENTLGNDDITLIKNTIETISKDTYFQYFRKFPNIDYNDTDRALNSIYKKLKETFFIISKEKPTINGKRTHIEYVDEIELPQKRTGLNLLYKYQFIRDENYDDDILGEILADEYVPSDEELDKMPFNNFDIFEENCLNEETKQILKEYRKNHNISDNP